MPACFGHARVGAGEQQAALRVSAAALHTLAVHAPLVAVALGARRERREVGSRVGLREQLAPDLLAGADRAAASARTARACRARPASAPIASPTRYGYRSGTSKRPSSWATTAACAGVAPRPPYSAGQVGTAQPPSARARRYVRPCLEVVAPGAQHGERVSAAAGCQARLERGAHFGAEVVACGHGTPRCSCTRRTRASRPGEVRTSYGGGSGSSAREPGRERTHGLPAAVAERIQRFTIPDALAVVHDGLEYGPGVRERLVLQPQHIGVQDTLIGAAEHLLAAGQCRLPRRQLQLRPGVVLDELVHDAEVGASPLVPSRVPDAEGVDRRTGGDQRARCGPRRGRPTRDLHLGEAAVVEDGADLAARTAEVARVDAAPRAATDPRARIPARSTADGRPGTVSYVSSSSIAPPGNWRR